MTHWHATSPQAHTLLADSSQLVAPPSRDSRPRDTAASSLLPSRLSLSSPLADAWSAPCGRRDSLISILDDPFFQRFDPAWGASSDPNPCHADKQLSDSNGRCTGQPWPPPRRESLTIGPMHSYWSHSVSAMESYNIAVIGSSAVGKSTFIQRVLGLVKQPTSHLSTSPMLVDNVGCLVTLFELDPLDSFHQQNPHQPVSWPKQINGLIYPPPDAALVLYNVMDRTSLRGLPHCITSLTRSGVSTVLVACQCDNPQNDWQIDVHQLAAHESFASCIDRYTVSMHQPEVSRACLQKLLRVAMSFRKHGGDSARFTPSDAAQPAEPLRDDADEQSLRRRAQSAANLEAPDPNAQRPLSQHSKHSRASSDFTVLHTTPSQHLVDSHGTQVSRSPKPGIRIERPGGDFLVELEESDQKSDRNSDDIPLLQRSDDEAEKQSRAAGAVFDELVDRLLSLRLTKADNNFFEIFLCLYRKFASPSQLLSAIIERIDGLRGDKVMHYLTKMATQLRMIEAVAKWVSLYPGDFARPASRRNLEALIAYLSTEPIFSIAARQMRYHLQFNVVEDDDTSWVNSDDIKDGPIIQFSFTKTSETWNCMNPFQLGDLTDNRPCNGSETSAGDKQSNMSSQLQFGNQDDYERQAALLEPKNHQPVNKFRWRIFMDLSIDDVSDELTRIDWIMFSSIRIRDLVRHVSLSATQKAKCKSLRNVNRMVQHFNHIAKWVANMILVRDKARHRAQILERFIDVAVKLRQLNNYNGLAAVLAGINGTPVMRLSQTWALLPEGAFKRFRKLEVLMGTEKSHFAYRLAWENSSLPRIPFMPLHSRDLVSAEEGGKTYIGPDGDRINWKKFEILGEVLVPIMRSQGTPYPNMNKNETARQTVLDCCIVTDDDEIYERSYQVENNSSSQMESTRKRFPWFAK
ncbi:hypothetical protein CDD81_7508 [Ophiocordyceps australis]|uniref:Ras-GEF domain-containing protein n=1 Tax=Ophiocordyceps australis TaxID=1399860 RepID=A0A2C5YFQ8_9HYPO|nr:hypothetical protein CDD81_7508 [Ophiocordyceps australis]